ncbi:hypothetical protein BDZ97DRAFT_1788953 [Flammula alnicola]|nr:hypothetical protein BDZ97DRAFT_1788953 [Flammula alnicola]
MIVLVQSFYLRLIWVLAGNIMLNQTISRVIKSLSLLTFLYAIGVAIAFLSYVLFSFSVSFEKMLYVAFGSTAVIDCGVAAVMSLVLVQTRSQASHTSTNVINYLVTFFVATGFLTAVAAVLTIVLYIVRPSTVLYLTVEFSVPKLYANSILAMFNAKSRMQKHMNTTEELKVPSVLFFGDAPAGNEEDGSS